MSLIRYFLSFALLVNLSRAIPFPKNTDLLDKNDLLRPENISYRLPRNAIPIHYKIRLTPEIVPYHFTFLGESSIRINVTIDSTRTIILHAKNLTIHDDSTTLVDSRNIVQSIESATIDPITDFLIITPKSPIKAGVYTLNLTYNGLLSDDLTGFYRSWYINSEGKKTWLATTQFEPTYARKAFPCFDEPAMKATFEISIRHFENYTAVSNMPVKNRIRDEEDTLKWWTNFEVTPVMSSYLIAFIISDFTFISNDVGTFRVWSRDNAIHTGRYAHYLGQKGLSSLENYLGIKHVIPKMDNFAIPQFQAGAMENWGIVTYRESALLFEENVTTTAGQESIATVISHEFTHQWFGDLVSPLWWSYTWLNEGFANYFQYFITDEIEPSWRLMDQFVIKNLQATAFIADDNEKQHAMNVEVSSPKEIKSIFDNISYSKAGCVIRMISHVLGAQAFQDRLNIYLTRMQFSAAESSDLFRALGNSETIQKDVLLSEAMDSWAKQPGYPVVTVIRDYKAKSAVITQKRFLTKPSKKPTERWWVPINYATEGTAEKDFEDTKTEQWLDVNDESTVITNLKETEWVIFNKQQTGYYRVNYDARNWRLIAEYLKNPNNTKIHVLNRAQLLDDSFNLVEAGELNDHTTFLEISEYLENEDDYVPWYAAYRAILALKRTLVNTEMSELFKLYIRRLTVKLEDTLGYTENSNDTHILKFNRVNTINLACSVGSKKCLDATHRQLLLHVNGSSKISADLRSVVLCSGIRSADSRTWERTYNLAVTTKDVDERNALLMVLSCSHDVNILRSYLNRTMIEGSNVTRNDVIKPVCANNDVGIDVVFDFIEDNLETIIASDGNHNAVLNYMNEIGSRITNVKQVEKLEKFIDSLPSKMEDLGEAIKAKALVNAKDNLTWLQKYGSKIASFLKTRK